MAGKSVTESPSERLLEQLRSRRRLPRADERRRIREAAGVSIRQLATALDVSPMAPVRWERGAQPRDPDQARAYGQLLDELRRLSLDEPPTRGGDGDG